MLRYDMGLKIDGHAIPDPSVMTISWSDIDIEGERDTTGTLHRKRVAEKEYARLTYRNVGWDVAHGILKLVRPERFKFTLRSLMTNSVRTIESYRGSDVTATIEQCFDGEYDNGTKCLVTFDISLIQY